MEKPLLFYGMIQSDEDAPLCIHDAIQPIVYGQRHVMLTSLYDQALYDAAVRMVENGKSVWNVDNERKSITVKALIRTRRVVMLTFDPIVLERNGIDVIPYSSSTHTHGVCDRKLSWVSYDVIPVSLAANAFQFRA